MSELDSQERSKLIESALKDMGTGGNLVEKLSALVSTLRPVRKDDSKQATKAWRLMMELLERTPEYRIALRSTIWKLFDEREQRRLYTEGGMLPNSGFFTELRRIMVSKILPEIPDATDLKDCVQIIFSHTNDERWITGIPRDERLALWQMLYNTESAVSKDVTQIIHQLLDSALILARRIAVMGIEPELRRVNPRLARGGSPFMALADETLHFVEGYRADGKEKIDERHLLVLIDQCRAVVEASNRMAAQRGTSMTLTYLIVRLDQHIERFNLLIGLLALKYSSGGREEVVERWYSFLNDVLTGERQRNSLQRHISSLIRILALRISENASQVGEHYIARDRNALGVMWRSAAGGGFFIAFMALIKILGTSPFLPIFLQGIQNSLIYSLGFVLIHLLHFSVATKQPAMTAATIAASIQQSRDRINFTPSIKHLISATARSQFTAILGNISIAFPLAVGISMATSTNLGLDVIQSTKAMSLVSEVDIIYSPSLVYAAVAGVWLFLAGIVTGYVDNVVAYNYVGVRISSARWLNRICSVNAACKIGNYLGLHFGGIAGNVFFGFALGMTPALGKAFGLPIDIRHIAFSAANIGYAFNVLGWNIDLWQLVRSLSGVAAIGLINLLISFSLALSVALLSRGVKLQFLRNFLT